MGIEVYCRQWCESSARRTMTGVLAWTMGLGFALGLLKRFGISRFPRSTRLEGVKWLTITSGTAIASITVRVWGKPLPLKTPPETPSQTSRDQVPPKDSTNKTQETKKVDQPPVRPKDDPVGELVFDLRQAQILRGDDGMSPQQVTTTIGEGKFTGARATRLLIELQLRCVEAVSPAITEEQRKAFVEQLHRLDRQSVAKGDCDDYDGSDNQLQILINRIWLGPLFGIDHDSSHLIQKVKEAYGQLGVGQSLSPKETAHWLVETHLRKQGKVRVSSEIRAKDNGDCWYESVALAASHALRTRLSTKLSTKDIREAIAKQIDPKQPHYQPMYGKPLVPEPPWDRYLRLIRHDYNSLQQLRDPQLGDIPNWGTMRFDARVFTDIYPFVRIVAYEFPEPGTPNADAADATTGLVEHAVGREDAEHTLVLVNPPNHFDPMLFA